MHHSIVSRCCPSTAQWNAVEPPLSRASYFAPFSRNSSTVLVFPANVANIRLQQLNYYRNYDKVCLLTHKSCWRASNSAQDSNIEMLCNLIDIRMYKRRINDTINIYSFSISTPVWNLMLTFFVLWNPTACYTMLARTTSIPFTSIHALKRFKITNTDSRIPTPRWHCSHTTVHITTHAVFPESFLVSTSAPCFIRISITLHMEEIGQWIVCFHLYKYQSMQLVFVIYRKL